MIVIFASKYSVKLRKKLDQINRLFLESLEGVRVIRAFNKQQKESERFHVANQDYANTAMTTGKITSWLLPTINVVFGMTTVAVLGMGAGLCRKRNNGGWLFSSEQPDYQHGVDGCDVICNGGDDVSYHICMCRKSRRGIANGKQDC